jgi:thiosulfate/3-mercaptopyruvate sulfurtransferase
MINRQVRRISMKRNSEFSISACLLASLISLAVGETPKDPAGADPAHPELVVSTQWLADHQADPNLVIVHIGHDESDYRAAHIPGARYLAMNKFATGQTSPGTELLPPQELKKNLEAIGIGDSSRVVYYAPDWDPMATRLFFTMDYLGHGDQAALLDGGLDQWTREKRPTSTEIGAARPGSLTVHLHPEIVAKMDFMRKLVDDPDRAVVIVDARPSKRYRNGHLRGSQSLYWENALVSEKEPLLKSPDQLRQFFAAAGITGKVKAVSYCEVGLQASYVYMLARYLGFGAAMYDGSYNEWSEAKQPVVRGDSPQ